MLKIVSWNIGGFPSQSWRDLLETDADIALLQEANWPPADVRQRVQADPGPWDTAGAELSRLWKAAVVKLSDRVQVEWIDARSIPDAGVEDFAVSRRGTVAAAVVTLKGAQPIIVVSMYGAWERPVEHPGLPPTKRPIWADGSVHRIISDVERLLGRGSGAPSERRVIAAGDLNILHGHGEHGNAYAKARYAMVFHRMEAIGLPFVGPQSPNGLQADPWPKELPEDSLNVPTYRTKKDNPATATRQLDFVFASEEIKDSVRVRALNGVDEWGPSDHCRIEIEVDCV